MFKGPKAGVKMAWRWRLGFEGGVLYPALEAVCALVVCVVCVTSEERVEDRGMGLQLGGVRGVVAKSDTMVSDGARQGRLGGASMGGPLGVTRSM